MDTSCNSKPQGFKKPRKINNLSEMCKFKLNIPLIFESGHMLVEKNQMASGGNEKNFKSPAAGGKLKFQCHYEERKRRAELKRRKMIQNIKRNYQINVEGFNEDVTREIIRKVELMEKEKKERERRNNDRSVAMITRLLEEQKYKNRGTKAYNHLLRRSLKNAPKEICTEKRKFEFETLCISEIGEQSEISFEKEPSIVKFTEIKEEPKDKDKNKESQEEEIKKLPKCIETVKAEESKMEGSILNEETIQKRKRAQCVPTEYCLESTPKCVIFQDYEKDKVYLQDLKITNIGSETIHCRYLGIVVHTKTEERFPVGVAVRDNVKLRPGLSCSTKIRLCSQDDTRELQSSIVYETRKKDNPSKYSWFFVKVICLPVQALVEVVPTKIAFPSLSWCEALDPKNSQLLKKIIKIKNSGGKACSCKITDKTCETGLYEEVMGEEETEEEDETVTSVNKSGKSETLWYRNSKFTRSEEFFGEDYLNIKDEAIATSVILINELIDNVFATFRFCPKYYIEIPPFSTIQIEVRFIPHYKGFHHEIFFLQFENCDNRNEEAVEIQGDIKKMPIVTEPLMIDLKICVANSGVYAGTFKIFNESKAPYSVFLKVPSSLKEHANVHPKTANIMPHNYSDFSVRVYPRVSLAMDAPQYYKKDSQILEFPVFIYGGNAGACKKDRIKIYVFALVTDYRLQLLPSFINFGTVTTLETARAELELINHSLAPQEYGFLNLPKGVRIEPNMGFGKILPKESIKLYLLYSPGEDSRECDNSQPYEFQVAVTSIAEYGGFREKLEREEESVELWGEDYGYEFPSLYPNSLSNEQSWYVGPEDSQDFDVCEEYSSDDEEEFFSKIDQQEKKIRDFLKEDRDKKSEFSFFKRMDIHARDDVERSKTNVAEMAKETFDERGEYGEGEDFERGYGLKENSHIVNCRAFITQPRCRLSESVIQLPATPCSSFSLYRFRLTAFKESGDESCSCGFRKVPKKCADKSGFKGRFEFQYFCPHVKLEPESGFFTDEDSLPITIIFRPEFPADQVRQKSRMKKAEKFSQQKKTDKDTLKTESKQSKGKPSTSKAKASDLPHDNAIDMLNANNFDLENCDLFAGERSLQELINPFHVETKIRCIIKTSQCGDKIEKTEIHEMVLICPAVKPNFIYLGNSQEIRFNKVLVGTRSKTLLQIQNISFERISPSITLLNPVGAFHCPAGVRKVEVDPEHIWQQPLTFAPLESKGIEKQYFEIYCDSTNIFLTVSGEGIQPEFKVTPNFASSLLSAKLGTTEELKLEIENLSVLKLNLIVKTEFVKEGPDLVKVENVEEEAKVKKSTPPASKDSKKPKTSAQFWEDVPEFISSAMENLVDIQEGEPTPKIFTLANVGSNNEVMIQPSGKQQFKIQFTPPANKSDVIYAAKYILMLEGVSPLKEMLVVGKILKVK